MFAVASCLEASAAFLGVILFSEVYDDTSKTLTGLPFVIGALLLIVPAGLVGFVTLTYFLSLPLVIRNMIN